MDLEALIDDMIKYDPNVTIKEFIEALPELEAIEKATIKIENEKKAA